MHFRLYPSRGEWRWTLYASNGRKIASSGEAYHNKADARSAIRLVKCSVFAGVREIAERGTTVRITGPKPARRRKR